MAAMIKIMKLESLDEEKSLFDISPTSNKIMDERQTGKSRIQPITKVGYAKRDVQKGTGH